MLLLHTCCAPCVLPIIEYLLTAKKPERIALYFYNPNIFPRAEYKKRLMQTQKIARIYNIKLYKGRYNHQDWLNYLLVHLPQPPASYPENGQRCLKCFQLRLEKTAQFAKKTGFKEFAATLSVSPFKDTEFINRCGQALAKKYHIKYALLKLDINNSLQIKRELIKKYNIYSQKYCGCEFSKSKL